jgi:hypothetical protein
LSTRARIFVRQNVIGLVALFVALSGTALALPGKNTVDSGDIKPANVTSSDLAPDSVDSSKVVDNSITGDEVKEGSLGQVPSAANAAQATTATTATTAGDANTLDGHDSDFFLQFGSEAGGDLTGHYPTPSVARNAISGNQIEDDTLSSDDIGNLDVLAAIAPETCNDSTVGAGGAANCLSGLLPPTPFSIAFTCEDTGANRIAQILIEDVNTGESWAVDSDGPNGAADQTLVGANGTADQRVLASAGPTATPHFQGGDFMALANGHILSGEIAVGTNVFGSDCASAFSLVG